MNGKTRIGRNLDSYIDMLASEDGATRLKARKSMVALGKPAVSPFTRSLRKSKLDYVCWEAVKTLDAIGDPRAIPSIVKVLEDRDPGVTWVAAEVLRKLKQVACPPLLRVLVKSGSESALLRQRGHHVFRYQRVDGFDNLLATLMKALEFNTAPISTKVAAYDILRRMKTKR